MFGYEKKGGLELNILMGTNRLSSIETCSIKHLNYNTPPSLHTLDTEFTNLLIFLSAGLVQKQESQVEEERKTFTAEHRFWEGIRASVQWSDATFPRGQFSKLWLPQL